MRWLVLLFAVSLTAAAAAGLTSEPRAAGRELLDALFASMPPDDFDYDAGARLAELEEALDAIAPAEAANAAACRRRCEATQGVLERSCDVLLQPAAARSRAVCQARLLVVAQQCRAECRS